MKIGVYDLIDSKKHFYLESVAETECSLIDSVPVRPLLVEPNKEKSGNRAPYLIDKDNVILDDIASMSVIDNKQSVFRLDFRNVYSIDKLLYGLMSEITEPLVASERRFRINLDRPADKRRYRSLLDHWFSFEKSLLNRNYRNKGLFEECQYTIIPITENCDVDAQDCILQSNMTSGSKTVLLWRSVAAYLGMEEKILSNNLKKDDNIYIIDSNVICTTMSKITIHERDGRLIPGHHLYKYSGSSIRNLNSYPYEVYPKYGEVDNISSYFPFKNDTHGIYKCELESAAQCYDSIPIPHDAKCVLCIGDTENIQLRLAFGSHPIIYRNIGEECVVRGAGRFANRMSHGIVSYFDECEALSVARVNKNEEVEKHILIEASTELEGGLEVKGDTVTDLSIDLSNETVEFYLLLGEQSDTRQLKVLRQKINSDFVKAKTIPIKMEPTLVAGQGRAKVNVDVLHESDREYMTPVFLDWENMIDAVDEGNAVSIEYLEEHMERTFPANIPAPSMNYTKFDATKKRILQYLESDGSKSYGTLYGTLNMTGWPRRGYSKGVEQFERDNIFGSPYGHLDMPRNPKDMELCISFFQKLNEDYKKHAMDYSFITPIAWTYHADYFPTLLDRMRRKLKKVITGEESTLRNQEISVCTNLFSDNCNTIDKNHKPSLQDIKKNDLILFMNAFFVRCNDSTGLSNWLRGAYQMVMYNTAFLEYLDIDKIYANINNVLSYLSVQTSKGTFNQVYSYFIFLLKVRRYHSTFCKPIVDACRDHIYYTKLMYLTEPIYESVFTSIVRMKQCMETPLVLVDEEDSIPPLSCNIEAHDFASFYSKLSLRVFRNTLRDISLAWFPNSIKEGQLYKFNTKDYQMYSGNLFARLSINRTILYSVPRHIEWANVLKSYLNGKGNLNLPVEGLNNE